MSLYFSSDAKGGAAEPRPGKWGALRRAMRGRLGVSETSAAAERLARIAELSHPRFREVCPRACRAAFPFEGPNSGGLEVDRLFSILNTERIHPTW